MSRAQDRGSRFQRGSGVFKCEGCGRSTRKTAATSGHDGRLCEDCFELAGIYNVYQDGPGDLPPYFGEIIARCASIRAKGGTVDPENAMLEQLALSAGRTVTAFLQTEEFEKASHCSGNSEPADFKADSDGRVARTFGGAYTVEEVRALLHDLEHVQAACDRWRQAVAS